MSQKSSDPQAISFVSQPLKRDSYFLRREFHREDFGKTEAAIGWQMRAVIRLTK